MASAEDEIVGGPGLSTKDAKLLKDLMERIRRDRGRLSTAELHAEIIDRSRPSRSPTHHLYEWDLGKAHAIYLLERTRQLVMRVQVIFSEMPEKPLRYVRIVTVDGKKGPLPVREIMQSQELRASLLEEAKADLERWSFRYRQLAKMAELTPVFDAIERATAAKKPGSKNGLAGTPGSLAAARKRRRRPDGDSVGAEV
jgi:hypothetical protein